jgi:hypothetical protein
MGIGFCSATDPMWEGDVVFLDLISEQSGEQGRHGGFNPQDART